MTHAVPPRSLRTPRRTSRCARLTFCIVAVALLIAILSNRSLAQESTPALTMSAALEWSQVYRPDAWQPVRFEFRNAADQPMDGTAVLPLANERAPAVMRLPVSIPPHSTVAATLWGYFPRAAAGAARKKQDKTPPLTTVEFRGVDGSTLARSEILGVPLSIKGDASVGDEGAEETGEMVLVVDQRAAETVDETSDATPLVGRLSETTGAPMTVASLAPAALPRQSAALRAARAIVLQDLEPDALDLGQRAAMLEYLRGGGTVIVAAPSDASLRAGSWLGELSPVRLIGTRWVRQVDLTSTSGPTTALKLRQPMTIVEAVEADGADVLLRGRDFVHAAERRVGLGRVLFTSFPINALDDASPQNVAAWEQLLVLRQPQWEWNRSALGTARHEVLGAMIGRPVAAWGVAAGVVGGYLALVLAAQLLLPGAARPKAFAVSMGAAVVLSGGLLAVGMARRAEPRLQSARLSILDVAADGSGWRHDSVAFIGADDSKLALRSSDPRTMIRPALADSGDAPAIDQQPFGIDQAGVFVDRIERVWESSSPINAGASTGAAAGVRVTARFGPRGLSIDVANSLGRPIEAPLMVWNRGAFSLRDLPNGHATADAMRANDRDDFTNSAVLTSDLAKRRGRVVGAMLSAPGEATETANRPQPPPQLMGWISGSAGGATIAPADRRPVEEKSMTMLRAPLRIDPPAAGTTIAVPAALVAIETGKMPYDRVKGETIPSQQDGQWLVAFAVPREIAQVRPTRATLDVRLTLPAHVMEIRKAQCANVAPRMDSNGALVAQWGREVAAKQITFDVDAADVDRDGRLWLLIDVRGQSATPGQAGAPTWQIRDLDVALDADVVAPPSALDLGAATAPSTAKSDEEAK